MSCIIMQIAQEVMRMLLHGDDDALATLRRQFDAAEVADLRSTGVGFFVQFNVPEQVTRLKTARAFSFGDVEGKAPSLKNGAGFVLHVREGVIDELEGYTYDEAWPADIEHFRLSYISGPERDLAQVRSNWASE